MGPNTKTVLCVDDDPETLKVRKSLLNSSGYQVRTAASGAEALAILAQDGNIDLVLLDFAMPGMNGDELAGRLRQLYPNLRLIAVSAIGQLPPAFLDLVDAQVQKGHAPETLLATITGVAAKSGSRNKEGRSSSPQTVLCVEDEQLELHLRKILFESAGFTVLQARSAKAALELFRAQHVDAVVMDYWLSDRNGTLVAEEMKRLRPRIPVIILSGFSSLPGEGAVVDAWLRKAQVEPEEIVETVKRLISRHNDTQEAVFS